MPLRACTGGFSSPLAAAASLAAAPAAPALLTHGRPPRRHYAAPAPDPPDLPPWPRSPHPTPYEILGLPRGAPYSKRRFYQLVKLYHPDAHERVAATGAHNISSAARLERYRLVVAANELLGDAAKRRLYDRHGVGWTDGARGPRREADRAWRHRPGNASRNATWEDWQRWRDERDGRAERVYVSNGTFAALVVCMCMVGALAQMNRAEALGEQHAGFAQQRDWAVGQQMRDGTLAAEGRSKGERVDCFLRERGNAAFGYRPGKFDEGPSQPAGRSRTD
ncbi:uncharacterized protein UV8b_07384 [Ustilaginoidea virens]|uniref:J domain-containing protein n=1 Tax=Ustilaginoidea virens TaxID=1159556 RepID=A0A8E5HX29_USTVR|nr:uncharacterized protein UV8b_07384 [Ustilaginoidea virens]QUC23143.1 hypothetical protein UV8b_07384 [Ustilaginoidea virens]